MANEDDGGGMDITEQKRTFEGFIKITTYVIGAVIVLLLFLAAINS